MTSILLFILGIGMIQLRFQIYDFLGKIQVFEEYVGSTENGLALSGVLLMLFSIAYGFGWFDGVMLYVATTFF